MEQNMRIASYIYFSNTAPTDLTQLWAKPVGNDTYSLQIFNNGAWRPLIGSVGKSAYELAVEKGYPGTLEEWLLSLKGVQGNVGPQGEQGPAGPQGPQGEAGTSITDISYSSETPTSTTYIMTFSDGSSFAFSIPKGEKGDKGDTGETGATGETGPKGDKGDKGDTGAAGTNGTNGINGVDGEDAYQPFKGWFDSASALSAAYPSPQVGDFAYVKGATSTDPVAIYACAIAGTWADSGNTFNPANNQEFASGEALNTVHIVDGLESSSATDVLSAKQGKVLDQKVSTLGPKIDRADKDINGYDYEDHLIQGWDSSGTYLNTAGNKHILLDVDGGETFEITGNGSTQFQISFMTTKPTYGDSISYSSSDTKITLDGVSSNIGYKAKVSIPPTLGLKISGTIPSDVKCLLILAVYQTTNIFFPSKIVINGKDISKGPFDEIDALRTEIASKQSSIDALQDGMADLVGAEAQTIDTTQYSSTKGIINVSSGLWDVVTNPNYQHIVVPVIPQKIYRITANNAYRLHYTVLKSYVQPSDNGDSPVYATGYSGVTQLYEDVHVDVEIPSDGAYLYITSKLWNPTAQTTENTLPSSLVKKASNGRVSKIEEQISNIGSSITQRMVVLTPNAELPTINFQFDYRQGEEDIDLQVAQLFESYGLRCGFALRDVSQQTSESIDMFATLQKKGHSILDHTGNTAFIPTNFPTVKSAYDAILAHNIALRKKGFVVSGFVAPQSNYDSSLIDAVKSVYAYGATYADSAYNGREANPCCTVRQSMENVTVAFLKRRIAGFLNDGKIFPLYGHLYNFGTTGSSITSTLTITEVSLTGGSGIIKAQGNIQLNASSTGGTLTRSEGGGDGTISYSQVDIDSNYNINTFTVSGITTAPSVGDKYTCVTSDVWSIEKLTEIIEYCIGLEEDMRCRILSPDESYKYYFKL